MLAAAQALVDDIGDLVSLPELVLRINEKVNSDNSSAAEIGELISQDPALTTRLLRVANSPMYAKSGKIESVQRAVTILGIRQIRDLILSASAAKVFTGIPNDIISVQDFWHHSLYCALLARSLASHSRGVNPETVFTAGMLHDIGQLVIFNRLPEQAHAVILRTVQGEANLDMVQAENEILGYDHCEVGASLAHQWHLPEILVECIACHHDLSRVRLFPAAVAHIHIANAIASLPYSDIPDSEDLHRVSSAAWVMAGLSADDLGEAIKEAQDCYAQTRDALFGQA